MLFLSLFGCSPHFDVTPRADGQRAPLTATCDDSDPSNCLLPFPSSTFSTLDTHTETGIRVAVSPAALPIDDDPTWLNNADGFSRLTPITTAFPKALDAESLTASVHLYVAYADGQTQAREIPLRVKTVAEDLMLIGYPLEVLPANADMVAVITDDLQYSDGSAPTADLMAQLALDLVEPTTEAEATRVGYHAPTRRLLKDAGIDPQHVVRVWDFSTRSANDPAKRLNAMLAVPATPSVTITEVTTFTEGDIAMVVNGSLDGLPDFRTAHFETLALDAEGLPIVTTTRSAPFRIVIPAGTDDYRIAMYGHGTGGDVSDDNFDADLAARNLAKIGIEFLGWNGDDLLLMITDMTHFIDGSARSTSALLQTMSDVHQILLSLDGVLGETLGAETINGQPNPAAGRHPVTDIPFWVGGSLGGTNGAIMVNAFPEIRYGVLNVPAGAWSHIIPDASLYKLIVQQILEAWYPTEIDAQLAIISSQNAWDDVDGAAWEPGDSLVLLQESIGDPVVPNAGTALLAYAMHATLVGAPIDDLVSELPMAEEANGVTALTQYRTSATEELDIHGFADTDWAAGVAAREQISDYLQSVLDGSPHIGVPPTCVEHGSCDFYGTGL